MGRSARARTRHRLHAAARSLLGALPRELRFGLYRRMVDCPQVLDDSFEFTIARTRDDLEACFALLHDAYVASGFMAPHASGLRVTPYHALPTTTTLAAKVAGQVVGTLSIVREGVFGFPLQSAFDITAVRARGGRIAEISALAVHPSYRRTGGKILFPLMKFMYEYCTRFFDTRHLVIAVHPNRIELYESLLFFRRLTARTVDRYDFANGAPAVGATLDLSEAPQLFRQAYGGRAARRDLHRYFVELELPNIRFPARDWHVSNDPILTPALADHFFNARTQGFAELGERKKRLLHSIYDLPEYDAVLPKLPDQPNAGIRSRKYRRYSFKCPGYLTVSGGGQKIRYTMQVVEVSKYGFQAKTEGMVPLNIWSDATIKLGWHDVSTVKAMAVRDHVNGAADVYGFNLGEPDLVWNKFVTALTAGKTHGDLENATRFMV